MPCDWTDASAYSYLSGADRSCFAWEWLRRDRAYREAAAKRTRGGANLRAEEEAAAPFALHAFEDPALPASGARPVWRAEAMPFVIRAAAEQRGTARGLLDLERLGGLWSAVRGQGGAEHVLISDGRRSLRIDVRGARAIGGPVLLRFELAGLDIDMELLAIRRLQAVWRRGALNGPLFPDEGRSRRLILVLRAHDGLHAGAGQRQLAAVLLDPDAAAERWRIESPAVRSNAQRLVRAAGVLARGGWRGLLAEKRPS